MVLKLIGITLCTLLLVSCGGEEKNKTLNLSENPEPEKVDARTVYAINCSSCHGPDGKLGASQAADLSVSKMSDAEILKMINEGNDKGMMPYKDMLTVDERKSLVTFVKTLRK